MSSPTSAFGRRQLLLVATGAAALAAAFGARPADARSASAQVWSPFVLVAGLLLVGLVAAEDGLFAAAGHRLASATTHGGALFAGSAVMIGAVTSLLNLDTSVAFLTPVLVQTARSRGGGEAPLLYGCLLLSNAGSLLLPGSNLTNLIVLGHLHLSGAGFLARMWAPALASLVVTAAVVAWMERAGLRTTGRESPSPGAPMIGIGLVAVVSATVLIIVLHAPALPVAAVGVVAVGWRLGGGKLRGLQIVDILGLPLLVLLFGVAVALGTVGRAWSGPATLLSHLDTWGTAAAAAVGSVVMNNLPAAGILAARTPHHPFALLIGLNIGPNLCVTGSLAWLLWLRSARAAGAAPSLSRASTLGAVAVPLAMVGALLTLGLTGSS